jgi:hypothetical protein
MQSVQLFDFAYHGTQVKGSQSTQPQAIMYITKSTAKHEHRLAWVFLVFVFKQLKEVDTSEILARVNGNGRLACANLVDHGFRSRNVAERDVIVFAV